MLKAGCCDLCGNLLLEASSYLCHQVLRTSTAHRFCQGLFEWCFACKALSRVLTRCFDSQDHAMVPVVWQLTNVRGTVTCLLSRQHWRPYRLHPWMATGSGHMYIIWQYIVTSVSRWQGPAMLFVTSNLQPGTLV